MPSSHEGYLKFCCNKGASRGLKQPLAYVYRLIHTSAVDPSALKEALVVMMSFLCVPVNRTEANCRAVDMFFEMEDHWSVRWDDLPHDFRELLDDIGGMLHDTFDAQEVAENFASTPEQLRDRAVKLDVSADRKP